MSHPTGELDVNADWQSLRRIQAEAECLFSADAVSQILDRLAADVEQALSDTVPVVLCIMNGALPLVGALLARWDFLLELDYVHASRYGQETSGGELNWRAKPQIDLSNRTVLVVDDIFDEGKTLGAVVAWCERSGARDVRSCVLVEKLHDRKADGVHQPDFIGLQAEDRYLFGCGMDYKGFFRNLQGIYALPGCDDA